MKNKSFILGITILISFFLSSCDKEKDFVLNSAPPSANFQTFNLSDGLSLQTELQAIYSTYDLGYSLNFPKYMVGFQNTELGNFSASLFTQLKLELDNNDPGLNPVVDSVVLVIRQSGEFRFTGDSTQPISLKVLKITENIGADNYYSNSSIGKDPVPIATFIGAPNAKDSTLKIKIDNSYGTEILGYGTGGLSNNTNFIAKCNGICIAPDSNSSNYNKVIASLTINDTRNYLKIYYSNASGKGKSLKLVMDYTCRKFGNYFLSSPKIFNDTSNYAYIKGGNQVQDWVNLNSKITDLMKSEDLSIVKAILTFKIDPSKLQSKALPRLLIFPRNKSDKRFETLKTFNGSIGDDVLSTYGGLYNEKDSTYKFSLNLNLQKIAFNYRRIANYNFDGWVLFATAQSPVTAREIAIIKKSCKIELKYTKLN